MNIDTQKLHTHYLKLCTYYSRESTKFARENNLRDAEFWAGKSYAMQYAAFLLEEEVRNND